MNACWRHVATFEGNLGPFPGPTWCTSPPELHCLPRRSGWIWACRHSTYFCVSRMQQSATFFFCHLAALKESACTMEPTKSNRKPAPRLLRILLGSAKSESQQPTKQQWWIQIFRKISPTTVMLLSLSLSLSLEVHKNSFIWLNGTKMHESELIRATLSLRIILKTCSTATKQRRPTVLFHICIMPVVEKRNEYVFS